MSAESDASTCWACGLRLLDLELLEVLAPRVRVQAQWLELEVEPELGQALMMMLMVVEVAILMPQLIGTLMLQLMLLVQWLKPPTAPIYFAARPVPSMPSSLPSSSPPSSLPAASPFAPSSACVSAYASFRFGTRT